MKYLKEKFSHSSIVAESGMFEGTIRNIKYGYGKRSRQQRVDHSRQQRVLY